MRLQLTLGLSIAATAIAGCGGAPAHGAVSADVRTAIYQDTDRTTIGTGTVAVRGRPSAETTLSARYLLDVTTSASVDVVAAATGRWDEPRHEVMGGAAYSDGTFSASGSYVWSLENDWESHTASGGVSHDLDDHNVTLGLSGSYVHNHVWRASDPNFSREMHVASGSAQLVLVGSPSDIVSINYGLTWVGGYQASPYRFARIRDPAGGPLFLTAPEVHPGDRYRHTLTVRWNHALDPATALRSHARVYADDWGVASLTLGTELRAGIDEWELGFMVRAYGQLGASFYRDVYDQPLRYMTSDRELSSFWDVFAGPLLGWRSESVEGLHELRFEVRANGFAFHFPDFSRLPTRFGVVGELALGGSF